MSLPSDARIAIVLLSAIGDVVHAMPLVSSLADAIPDGRVEWFIQPVPGALARHHPDVDRVWIVERHRGWRGFADLHRRLRGERFDVVVDLQVYAKASLVTWMIDSPRKLGFDRARARELNWLVTNERIAARPDGHVREQYLEFADHLGARRRYAWRIALGPGERRERNRFLASFERPMAALVVATSDPRKDWPAERWARVAEGLDALGYSVCVVGGDAPRERHLASRLSRAALCPVRDERGGDLRRLLTLLDAAALVVSPDTGPYHMALALNVPAVGLFGATDPARHGPGHRFVDLVIDAYHDPGERWRPTCRERRRGRMRRIGVADVLAAAERARRRYRRAVDGPVDETEPSPP